MNVGEVVFEESYYERSVTKGTCSGKTRKDAAASEVGEPRCDRSGWEGESDCALWPDEPIEPEDPDDPFSDYGDPHHNRVIGKRGEDAAARYLERVGYEILARNWMCPAGEADIVARDGDAIVFIEVKTRTNIHKGFPAEAVNAEKRARYEKIAAWYLRDSDACDVPVRFDVISLMVLGSDRAFMKHYVNAYGVER